MTAREQGLLLLTSRLGVAARRILTLPQFRELEIRVRTAKPAGENRELTAEDLTRLGYPLEFAERVMSLLNDRALLEYYIQRGNRLGCVPLTRISRDYPGRLRERLGMDAPGCLWAKGDLSALEGPIIALVGSRDLEPENLEFARQAGLQAAKQGFTLVSGNARGADREAQRACLEAGGRVISVVADELSRQPEIRNVLYLSEDGFDAAFSAQRALRRNRIIHALGNITLAAQCSYQKGGTWSGCRQNLRYGWSPVFCFDDQTPAAAALAQMGAIPIGFDALNNLCSLSNAAGNLFDQ